MSRGSGTRKMQTYSPRDLFVSVSWMFPTRPSVSPDDVIQCAVFNVYISSQNVRSCQLDVAADGDRVGGECAMASFILSSFTACSEVNTHATTGHQIHPVRVCTTIYVHMSVFELPFGIGPFSYAGHLRRPSVRLFCRRVRFCGRSLSQTGQPKTQLSHQQWNNTTCTHVCRAVGVHASNVQRPALAGAYLNIFTAPGLLGHHITLSAVEWPVPAVILWTRSDLFSSPPTQTTSACLSGCPRSTRLPAYIFN